MSEEVQEKKQNAQTYSFPLPRKDKDLWEKQQNILKGISTKKLTISTIQELIVQLDFLRNSSVQSDTKYKNLQKVFEGFDDKEKKYFLEEFIPTICSQALKIKKQSLSNIIPKNLQSYQSSFTRREISYYICCMFLCLLKDSERKLFKDFRMIYTAHAGYDNINVRRQEKIKCIYDYLKQSIQFTEKEANEIVVFERINCGQLESYEEWKQELQKVKLKALEVHSDKLIEDFPKTLQVDFANASIGGGILGDGLVQEEIRFAICPEMLVSLLLFDASMNENEVILMKGIKQYCDYTGYSNTFRYVQMKNLDGQKTKRNTPETIIAIDALFFNMKDNQFSENNVVREINKAYIGFKQEESLKTIASGKWGCGAFNGVVDLKVVIQWIASSRSNKKLIISTFEDTNTQKQIQEIYQLYKQTKASQFLDLVMSYPESKYMEDYTLLEYLVKIQEDKIKK